MQIEETKMHEVTLSNLNRRRLMVGMLLGGSAVALPSLADQAAKFPAGPIRMVVPFPPGGGVDTLTRLIANELSGQMKQTIVVENKGGAGGMIGAKHVSQGEPDGHTLLLTAAGQVINPLIHRTPPFDIFKDFSPICYIGYVPQLVLVKSDFPANTFQEFVDIVKKKPDQLTWATSGLGTAGHFAEELIKFSSGLKMQVVAYRGGGPALTDLIAGHVDAMVEPLPSSIPHVKSGRLKALAVTSPKRAAALPNVPTVAESGIAGFELPSWYGIWGPPNVPKPIAEKIYHAVKAALNSPALKEKLDALSFVVVGESPDAFDRFIRKEVEKYTQVAKSAGIVIE